MVSVKSLIGAGAALLVSSAAYAADLGAPPPMQYLPQPQVTETGGWYLRGDVGVGIQSFSSFDLGPPANVPATWAVNQTDIQDSALLGFGIGYEFNSWLRFDVTGEYRTGALFHALGSYDQGTCTVGGVTGTCFDNYTGNFSAAVFMANAYVDLGTWWCLTPYIGAGIGTAYDRITGVQDTGPLPNGTIGFGYTYGDSSSWNLAWNVQAGLTYNVSDNFKIDFNWRYLDMGSPESANIYCQNTGTAAACNNFILKDITSQDFRIGFRWLLQPEPAPVVMPLSTRG
ncbi:MAG TPA: outer membrane beta-barrel protein [Xanthobacteraceae bacterium]|nr:outer membrane beta-barrel protein [Xanthobacteraceae bacterium]